MQTHGEENHPEPEGSSTANISALNKLVPGSPQFQRAERMCQLALPKERAASPIEQARVLNQALKFARRTRTHGMPNWPAPSTRGYMVAPAGAAAESPAYLKVSKICEPLLPTG